MCQKFNLVRLIIHFCFCCCNSQMTNIHASIYSLENLLRHEIEFKQHLDGYIAECNNNSNIVIDFIKTYYSNYDPGHDLKEYVSNPLNAFGLIKRTSYDLNNFLLRITSHKYIKTRSELKLYSKVKKLINDFCTKFPSIEDFNESCTSLDLVKEVYNLKIEDLMNGTIRVMDNSGKNYTI